MHTDFQKQAYYRNRLTQLGRLRTPTVCRLQSGNQGHLQMSLIWSPKTQGQEGQCLRAEAGMSYLQHRQRILRSSALLLYSGLPLVRCGPATLGRPPALLRLLIPMLGLSRNTLTDTPRKNAFPAIWTSPDPANLTCKVNPHHWFCEGYSGESNCPLNVWWEG